jgi:uncharacterized protein with PIN domain
MTNLKDLNELLKKIPIWKSMAGAPEWIDELETRLQALEVQIAGTAQSGSGTGDMCPYCNTPNGQIFRIEKDTIFGDIGGMTHYFECTVCNRCYNRQVKG